MGFILLILFIITEIVLVALTIMKYKEKKLWLKNRAIFNGIEVGLFVLCLLLPGIDFSFRFRLCFYLLLLRAVVSVIMFFIKRNKVEGFKSKFTVVLSAVIGIILISVSLIPSFIITGYKGVETTGEYDVKVVDAILVDADRKETFEDDNSNREVPIHFYYPNRDESSDEVYPLVVFSHGAFGYYQSNTSTYMELASNGYVVASLDHPYHSFFTKDTNGKTVTVNNEFIKDVMGATNENMSEEEILNKSHEWLNLRVEDEDFVLNSIEKLIQEEAIDSRWNVASEEKKEELKKVKTMINFDKIGLMGHSLGGATSVEVGRKRHDILAVVDIDGTMLGEEISYSDGKYKFNEEAYPVPLLELKNERAYKEEEEYNSKGEDIYVNTYVMQNAIDGRSTYFSNTEHMDFTDLPLISPFFAKMFGKGSCNSEECVKTMNRIILDFFNCYLKGEEELQIKTNYDIN